MSHVACCLLMKCWAPPLTHSHNWAVADGEVVAWRHRGTADVKSGAAVPQELLVSRLQHLCSAVQEEDSNHQANKLAAAVAVATGSRQRQCRLCPCLRRCRKALPTAARARPAPHLSHHLVSSVVQLPSGTHVGWLLEEACFAAAHG
jgi:hypothetical protein